MENSVATGNVNNTLCFWKFRYKLLAWSCQMMCGASLFQEIQRKEEYFWFIGRKKKLNCDRRGCKKVQLYFL